MKSNSIYGISLEDITIGHFLLKQRKILEFSRKKVSKEIGINQSTLAHIETDKIKYTTLENLEKLAKYYKFDLNVILRKYKYPGIASDDIKRNYIYVKDENEKKAVNAFLSFYRDKDLNFNPKP